MGGAPSDGRQFHHMDFRRGKIRRVNFAVRKLHRTTIFILIMQKSPLIKNLNTDNEHVR